MLAHARPSELYAELREADIIADLTAHKQRWPLILAADVLCYFGALEELLDLVHARLEPGGWFVFSVEEMLPDHDGLMPGNGNWALQRQGRYAHAEDYVYEPSVPPVSGSCAWTARSFGRRPGSTFPACCSPSNGFRHDC